MNWNRLRCMRQWGTMTEEEYMLLYSLINLTKPHRILEIGSGIGISTIVMASALKQAGSKGKIVTIEINKSRWRQTIRNIHNWKLEDQIEKCVLGDSHLVAGKYPSDFALIDGHHSYKAVKNDWEQVKDFAKIVVFHDTISRNSGYAEVYKLLEEISSKEREWQIINFENNPLGTVYSEGKILKRINNGIAIARKR